MALPTLSLICFTKSISWYLTTLLQWDRSMLWSWYNEVAQEARSWQLLFSQDRTSHTISSKKVTIWSSWCHRASWLGSPRISRSCCVVAGRIPIIRCTGGRRFSQARTAYASRPSYANQEGIHYNVPHNKVSYFQKMSSAESLWSGNLIAEQLDEETKRYLHILSDI